MRALSRRTRPYYGAMIASTVADVENYGRTDYLLGISNSQAGAEEVTRSVGNRAARDLLDGRRRANGGEDAIGLRGPRKRASPDVRRSCPHAPRRSVQDGCGCRRLAPGDAPCSACLATGGPGSRLDRSTGRAPQRRHLCRRAARRPRSGCAYALSAVGLLRSRQQRPHLMNQIAPYSLGVACPTEPD